MNADKIVFNKASDGNYATTGLSGSCVLSTWNDVVAVSDTLGDRIDEIEQKIKKPDVDLVVKTNMVYKNGGIYVKHYEDGFFQKERWLIPDITDVRVYDNTVVVKFADRTKTSAVLDSEDTFSLEQGISICITKKLLGEDGNSLYNKLITRAMKVIKKNEKAAKAAEKKKEDDKKARELKKARSERRKAKKREESINTQAEAIKRAISQFISGKVG